MSSTPDDEWLTLHRALIAGDAAAPALLAEKLLPALRMKLKGLNSRLNDPQIVESAIGQSVANYLSGPEKYDPGRGSLPSYLAMDATGDIKNELKKRSPEIAHEAAVERTLVEHGLRERNSTVEEDALDALDPFDLPRETVEAARRLLETLSPRDRELAQLVVDEVRSYAVWAVVLGLAHLPPEVQEHEVKRQKDRIKKKLSRMGEHLG